MIKFIALCALAARLGQAYSSSLEDCEEFAALWSANCGGTDEDSVYSTSDWETSGAGPTISSCSTNDDDWEVREPDTGNLVTSYSLFARNCITCRDTGGDVYIRYQSNNLPKFCYGSDTTNSYYPSTGKFDNEMLWNPNVLNTLNVAECEADSEDNTDDLLCTTSFTDDLPSSSEFSDNSTSDPTNFVGWTMDNVAILPAYYSSSKDAM